MSLMYDKLLQFQPTSDLLGLIQVLVIVFGEEPPVFSKTAASNPPRPSYAPGGTPYPTGRYSRPHLVIDSRTMPATALNSIEMFNVSNLVQH